MSEVPSGPRSSASASSRAGARSCGEVEEVAAWYTTVPAVPVTVEAAAAGVVGLCGPRDRVETLAAWLVAQAATLHSPRDLAISAVIDRCGPTVGLAQVATSRRAGGRRASREGRARRASVLEEIARIVSGRRQEAESSFGPVSRRGRPHVLLVLDEQVAPERSLIAELLGGDRPHDIAVLWLGTRCATCRASAA